MGGTRRLFELLGTTIVRDTSLDDLELRDKTVGIDAFIWLVAAKKKLCMEDPQFYVSLSPSKKICMWRSSWLIVKKDLNF